MKKTYPYEISFEIREDELWEQLCSLLLSRMRSSQERTGDMGRDWIIEKKKHDISIRFGKKDPSTK